MEHVHIVHGAFACVHLVELFERSVTYGGDLQQVYQRKIIDGNDTNHHPYSAHAETSLSQCQVRVVDLHFSVTLAPRHWYLRFVNSCAGVSSLWS